MPILTELPILAQGEGWIAVGKPAGLFVHRSALDRRVTEAALQIVRSQLGQWVYPVHRLDRPTSGVLLFALTPEAAGELGRQFRENRVRKTYLAIARGFVAERLSVEYPLMIDDVSYAARTEFERVAQAEVPFAIDARFPTTRYSLVRARPVTGRLHQIRRHLRHLGHPIAGDVTYGVGKHNRFFSNELCAPGLMLACTEMEFAAPADGASVRVGCAPRDAFRRACEGLGWAGVISGTAEQGIG